MRSTFLISTAWALSGAIMISAAAISPRVGDTGAPSVVGLEMRRGSSLSALQRHRIQRRGELLAPLDNLDTLYFLNATLGTPPQPVKLHLDTGSSDLWVNTPGSVLCSDKGNDCAASGTYVANASSTYSYLGSYFNISYVDGSGASGDYVTDTIDLGGASLPDFQFGIGYVSTTAQGILGIGYPANEVQFGRARMQPYENLPAKLKAQGLTKASAYSLYLNDLDSSTGSILFGGVDTDQFTGRLSTLPVQPQAGTFAEFLITLTAVSLGSTVLGSGLALAVLLDSGSSLTYLPDDMTSQIYSMTSAIYDDNEGVAFVPCNIAAQKATLDFTFTDPKISVEMRELVLDLVDSAGAPLKFSNGEAACLFGIAPAGSGTNVLGDTFLRSAYLVYDLDNNEISLAQSAFNATSSNVVEIAAGPGGVPSAVPVLNPVTATTGLQIAPQEVEGAAPAMAAARPAALRALVAVGALISSALLLGLMGA